MSFPELPFLPTFVAIYELGGATAAAAQLHRTQPTLSYQLAQLERALGAPLFVRQGRELVPTALANQLHRLAVGFARDLDVVRRGGESSSLDVASVSAFGRFVLFPLGTDLSPSASDGWEPVHVDRILHDGDTVELGGTKLEAVWAPGHTPGCTVWTAEVVEADRPYRVAMFACMEPSGDVKLVDNPKFPDLVEQTRATFRKLRKLQPDFALLVHPAEQLEGKLPQLRAGVRPSPLYDPKAWGRFLDDSEADLQRRVDAENAHRH